MRHKEFLLLFVRYWYPTFSPKIISPFGLDSEQDIMRMAMEAEASSICAYCSRMKRGGLKQGIKRVGMALCLSEHFDIS